jgi:hypothetical protein
VKAALSVMGSPIVIVLASGGPKSKSKVSMKPISIIFILGPPDCLSVGNKRRGKSIRIFVPPGARYFNDFEKTDGVCRA